MKTWLVEEFRSNVRISRIHIPFVPGQTIIIFIVVHKLNFEIDFSLVCTHNLNFIPLLAAIKEQLNTEIIGKS